MLGLFDKPSKAIRKRVPKETVGQVTAIESYTLTQLGDLSKNKQEMAIGIVLSVWAVNSHSLGVMQMTDYNFKHVHNLGINCTRFLNEHEQGRVYKIMDSLIEKN